MKAKNTLHALEVIDIAITVPIPTTLIWSPIRLHASVVRVYVATGSAVVPTPSLLVFFVQGQKRRQRFGFISTNVVAALLIQAIWLAIFTVSARSIATVAIGSAMHLDDSPAKHTTHQHGTLSRR